MEYADRGNLADALRSGRFPCHDFVAVYRCLLDIAAGRMQLLIFVMPCHCRMISTKRRVHNLQ